jgi:hypothetical protein
MDVAEQRVLLHLYVATARQLERGQKVHYYLLSGRPPEHVVQGYADASTEPGDDPANRDLEADKRGYGGAGPPLRLA